MEIALSLVRQMRDSLRDLAPVVLVMAFFQLVVIRQPLPPTLDVMGLAVGLVGVIVGLRCLSLDETPGTGIAFQLDVEDAVGIKHQIESLTSALSD